MALVKSCCGLWELKPGARNIAIISMIYDLLMTAGLLLVLLLYVPYIPFKVHPIMHQEIKTNEAFVYQIMLSISICIRFIHLIPSFLLLYSTWEEIPRGVSSWIWIGTLDVFLHSSWLIIPFLFRWSLDRLVITISFLTLGIFIIIYFLVCVNSYLVWIRDRYQDMKSKRRLFNKEEY